MLKNISESDRNRMVELTLAAVKGVLGPNALNPNKRAQIVKQVAGRIEAVLKAEAEAASKKKVVLPTPKPTDVLSEGSKKENTRDNKSNIDKALDIRDEMDQDDRY